MLTALPTLDEVAARADCVADLPQAAVMNLLLRAASVQNILTARLISCAASAPIEVAIDDAGDRLLTPDEVAQRFRRSSKFVYRHASKWPFARRVGRGWRFSEKGLERWIARQRA